LIACWFSSAGQQPSRKGLGACGGDALDGGAAADVLYAGLGSDSLEGGGGDDVLLAGADDGARDVADCGPGDHDRAVIRRGDVAFDCERVRVLAATVDRLGGEVIRGTRENDSLTGTERRDFIFGLAGDDVLAGLAGSDFLFGGRGADLLDGGEQRDDAWGGGGDDGAADALDCGENDGDWDRAVLRPGDTAVNCERVFTLVS
jgi:Ca2+-binding RTX toxin-like protein